jgi:hypothetical protein
LKLGHGLPPKPQGFSSLKAACLQLIDLIITWCSEQKDRQGQGVHETLSESAVESSGNARDERQDQRVKTRGRPQPESPTRRHWSQNDADNAIWAMKARYGDAAYRHLVEAVRKGLPGAVKQARTVFGRNNIHRKLGISKAMISKSPAWRKIAEELCLERQSKKVGRRMSLEAAQGKMAENGTLDQEAVQQQAIQHETIRLIRQNMNGQSAEALIEQLLMGEITDDRARQIAQVMAE